jgi:hypothetical protein
MPVDSRLAWKLFASACIATLVVAAAILYRASVYGSVLPDQLELELFEGGDERTPIGSIMSGSARVLDDAACVVKADDGSVYAFRNTPQLARTADGGGLAPNTCEIKREALAGPGAPACSIDVLGRQGVVKGVVDDTNAFGRRCSVVFEDGAPRAALAAYEQSIGNTFLSANPVVRSQVDDLKVKEGERERLNGVLKAAVAQRENTQRGVDEVERTLMGVRNDRVASDVRIGNLEVEKAQHDKERERLIAEEVRQRSLRSAAEAATRRKAESIELADRFLRATADRARADAAIPAAGPAAVLYSDIFFRGQAIEIPGIGRYEVNSEIRSIRVTPGYWLVAYDARGKWMRLHSDLRRIKWMKIVSVVIRFDGDQADLPAGTYTLSIDGKWCSDEEGRPVVCDRVWIKEWERFQLSPTPWAGAYSLRGGSTGLYCAEDSSGKVRCDQSHEVGFAVVTEPSGTVAIYGNRSGKRCVNEGGIVCNSTERDPPNGRFKLAAGSDSIEYLGCVTDERVFNDRQYFGGEDPVHILSSEKRAAAKGAQFFAVARDDGLGPLGHGFTFNAAPDMGSSASSDAKCRQPCKDYPARACGTIDNDKRFWAVYRRSNP